MSKASEFAALHRSGEPLVLFNAWDAGSARAVAEAGARAIATGSASVAAAHGCEDGEELPIGLALANAARIVAAVDLPVTIDFESGYGVTEEQLAATGARLAATGAVGCNLEDQRIGGAGLYTRNEQQARIAAYRKGVGQDFFVNARTDLFLVAPRQEHGAFVEEAVERAQAYAEAGADGLFVPGLVDEALIARICAASPLPVNIFMLPDAPPVPRLAQLGVARVSHGPGPYRAAMRALTQAAREALSGC